MLLVSFASGQDFCCDPDAPGGVTGTPFECGQEDNGYLPGDGLVCDPDCPGYGDGSQCTSIPLDGGLSLLALAGGGLATAAMRRRREEEEAAHHGA